jgi:hypothetical protein
VDHWILPMCLRKKNAFTETLCIFVEWYNGKSHERNLRSDGVGYV